MKKIFTLIYISVWLHPAVHAQKASRDSLPVTILLKSKVTTIDSVLLIFDKYDLTGAGTIKQVFYPSHNRIIINKVPRGKYYIDILCMGISHQTYTLVETIGERRSNKLYVPIKNFERYTPGKVEIPPSLIDFSNLLITRKRS
jgi:hypothetical protein